MLIVFITNTMHDFMIQNIKNKFLFLKDLIFRCGFNGNLNFS